MPDMELHSAMRALPADTALHVEVYEAGDPPRRLAFFRLQHTAPDPTYRITRVASTREDIPDCRHRDAAFQSGEPIVQACGAQGNLLPRGGRVASWAGIPFTLSLAEWLGEGAEHRRVYACIMRNYRRDLFTDEQPHLADQITAQWLQRGVV